MSISKKKIQIIINPISGGYKKTKIIKSIPKLLDTKKFDIFISHTKYAGHAAEIAKKAVKKNADIVVAVGGDGTINEIASSLVGTDTALAIIPLGSGNGLARDLNIPLHYKKAIQLINAHHIKPIDVGICNHQYFFSLAGIGFDAKVAYHFNKRKRRRFAGYFLTIVKDFFTTKEQNFDVVLDQDKITDSCFFITIANSSQWGYRVKVAPHAKLDDGVFNINFTKKPSFFSLIPFGIKMLSGRIDKSKYTTLKSSKKVIINAENNFFYHIDGDAKGFTNQIEIEILHKKLNIVENNQNKPYFFAKYHIFSIFAL